MAKAISPDSFSILRNLRNKIESYLKTEKEKLSALLTRQATLLPKSREKLS